MLSNHCCYRIFCLTDGEDNASRTPYWEVSQFCQQNKIILDSIPVAAENQKLKNMSLGTGGLSLRVTEMQKGASLFEREAVIKISSRDICIDTLPVIINETSLFCYNKIKAVEDVKTVQPIAMNTAKVMKKEEIEILQNQSHIGTGAKKRILKEYSSWNNDPISGVLCFVTQDNISFWKLIIDGPKDTPYEGGRFACYIRFPDDYPFKPLDFRFYTPIYHPNINNDGKICIDILKNHWSPAITLQRVVCSVIYLLKAPNPIDALDVVKANIYSDNRPLFNENARQHTLNHAFLSLEELKLELNIDT